MSKKTKTPVTTPSPSAALVNGIRPPVAADQPGAPASTKPQPPTRPPGRPAATGAKPARKDARASAKRTRAAVARPKAKRSSRRSGMSGLDAAAKVLSDAGKPMRCQDVAQRVLAKGLWKTSGKTPAATIHSAVIREIKLKGKQSRFKKAGRGLFAAR